MCLEKRLSRAGAGMESSVQTGIGHGTEAGRRGWRYRSRPASCVVSFVGSRAVGGFSGTRDPTGRSVSRAAMSCRTDHAMDGHGEEEYLRDVRCDGSLWLARGLG